eukprot:TRINITY_DN12534_c2_g1_i1.p1 TRINITY_DN12534_c2_g1~~TRINITY_DN12534_c2_g1_i1.p1  ORF type:complete len:142 (-),score=2.64 TRINITY_DN12534_c2_g1_i1:22-447(-)
MFSSGEWTTCPCPHVSKIDLNELKRQASHFNSFAALDPATAIAPPKNAVYVCHRTGKTHTKKIEVTKREEEKRKKYFRLSREESAVIIPGVVTTHGTLGGFYKKLINKTAKEALQQVCTCIPTSVPTGRSTSSALLSRGWP